MRVGIVGGGAAGLMAAATILETAPQAELFLIERNEGLGKKVIISGGGRCNVTTGIQDVRTVLTKYPRGGKFLSKAMYHFPPGEVYAWFESHGVPLKVENDLRVFPESNNGRDIVGVFENVFATSNVHVLLNHAVETIQKVGDVFELQFRNGDKLEVDVVVLTTGGQAYRQTGSVGDGYAFASSLGHTITKLAPSLNAFYTRELWTAVISGLSFQKAEIRARAHNPSKSPLLRGETSDGRTPSRSTTGERAGVGYSFTGPFIFTHKGVSGPAVFALSAQVAFEEYDPKTPLSIEIDLFPDESTEEVAQRIEKLISTVGKKSFLNVVAMVVPKSLAEIVLFELNINGSLHSAEIGKKDVLRCVAWFKGIPLTVVGRGSGDEFVTAGGVELSEVDPKTMESTICPGLYFGGEVLDIDGYTGGFNLQASWATGRLAGESIAAR